MDYHEKFSGRVFVEVVRGKARPPRRIRIVKDTAYDVGAVVISGRGKGKPVALWRKHLIDASRWIEVLP